MKKIYIIILIVVISFIGCVDSSTTYKSNETSLNNQRVNEQNPPQQSLNINDLQEMEFTSLSKVRILADVLNIRNQPTTDSDTISQCYEGYIFNVLSSSINSKNELWFQINYDNNKTGWVIGEYCKTVNITDGKPNYNELTLTFNNDDSYMAYYNTKVSEKTILLEQKTYEILETYIDSDNIIWYKIYSPSANSLCWTIGNNIDEIYQEHQTVFNDEFIVKIEDDSLKMILVNMFNISDDTITYGVIKDINSIYITSASSSEIKTLNGLEYFDNLTSLTIAENKIQYISRLARLKGIESLILYENALLDYKNIEKLINLETLNLRNNNINDITFIADLVNLKFLNLSDNEISEAAPLEKLVFLENINLSNNKIMNIDNLSKLTQLEVVHLDNNLIEDISPLSNLRKINYLSMINNNISDMSMLQNLISLNILILDKNKISNVETLKHLTNLQNFSIKRNNISEIPSLYTHKLNSFIDNPIYTEIQESTSFVYLNHDLEKIIKEILYDFSNDIEVDYIKEKPLSVNELKLVNSIDLRFTDESEATYSKLSLSGLENCPNLTELYFESLVLEDIDTISLLNDFETLGIYNCIIENMNEIKLLNNIKKLSIAEIENFDVSIIDSLTSLDGLYIGNTKLLNQNHVSKNTSITKMYIGGSYIHDLTFIKGLANITDLHIEYSQLENISHLSSLTKLQNLNLTNNNIADVSALKDLDSLITLYLADNNISDFKILNEVYPNLLDTDFILDD